MTPSVPNTASARRSVVAVVGALLLGAACAGPAAAAPQPTTSQCPASQMAYVWSGNPQETWSLDRCGDLAERYGHLFFPGSTLDRAAEGRYVEDVVVVQLRLRDLGHAPGPVDGAFGTTTEDAVERFQRAQRLLVDGRVGPRTWKALFGLA